MKNNKSFNKILELTETALATPEIKKDKNLCEILEKIKAYEFILIHRHKNPDPDAIGSQAGLRAILR